jgi:uncharacterized protein (TIGR03437 family)
MRAAKKLILKCLPLVAALALIAALAPVFHAQSQGSITKVTPVPDGAYFSVDGVTYQHAVSNVWPEGSKHTLFIPDIMQSPAGAKTIFTFQQWQYAGGVVTLNPFNVTASASIPEYQAVFGVQYALSIVFFNCPDPAHCSSPGSILANGAPINSTQDLYFSPGSAVIMLAIPNPGWVFAGWKPGPNQTISGFSNTVTLTAPTEVYPVFEVARAINIATVPDGLQILADRTPVFAGTTLDWGWDSVHSLGPVSPQQDKQGKVWVFSKWGDGGAVNHAYTVAEITTPDTVTATYIPAAPVSLLTQPAGLKLIVDGNLSNVLQLNYFTWGDGETHHIQAPQTQVDAAGRTWQFASWSNGGPASQDITVPANADTTGGIQLTATYTPLTKLTVTSSLIGLGVSVDGSACTTPCSVLRAPGSQIHVVVPASVPQGDGSRADFNGWPTGGTDFVVALGDGDQSLNAAYHLMNRLSATSNPPAGAVYTVLPTSSDGFYNSTTTVSVSLAVQPGYKFVRWDGDLSGTIPSGMVAMSAPRAVTGVLTPIPYIAPAGVMNAAGQTPQPGVAAGSIVSVFGANLANSTTIATDSLLPQTLGGVVVHAGDRLLPLIFTAPTQINAQLPDDLTPGNLMMTVTPPSQPNVQAPFSIVRNAPGIFAVLGNDGQFYSMALHQDGTAITTDSPAQKGELITVYGTGFGPADHPRLLGFPTPASPPYLIVDPVTVQANDAVITAEQAFVVPGRQGIDAVQFRLGDSAPTGTNANFKVTVNGVDSNTLLLPIQ